MKDFFKSGKNIAILVLSIVLAGSVACNICLATRRCAPRGPQGHGNHIEQFHNNPGGPQAQAPQGDDQGQPPQGQPPQGQPPNNQAPQDGQNNQNSKSKKSEDKKGNNDDKKDKDDDDDDKEIK